MRPEAQLGPASNFGRYLDGPTTARQRSVDMKTTAVDSLDAAAFGMNGSVSASPANANSAGMKTFDLGSPESRDSMSTSGPTTRDVAGSQVGAWRGPNNHDGTMISNSRGQRRCIGCGRPPPLPLPPSPPRRPSSRSFRTPDSRQSGKRVTLPPSQIAFENQQ